MTKPVITVAFDVEGMVHRLFATSYRSTEPAGERLFHSPPFPEIKFEHETVEAAQADAAKLTAYIERTWGGAEVKCPTHSNTP